MPINIYNEKTNDKLVWLCDDIWDLSTQIAELEKWLDNKGKTTPKGSYVADIGFSTREDSNGGGGVIGINMMRKLINSEMEIYLSEYQNK